LTLTEAGRVVGISEYRVRSFVKERVVIPIKKRPILLSKFSVNKLEDFIAHEKNIIEEWKSHINPNWEYRYAELCSLGWPISGLYQARGKSIARRIGDDGCAFFTGEDLLSYLKIYRASGMSKFTRGMVITSGVMYNPEEIARVIDKSLTKTMDIVHSLVQGSVGISLELGKLQHYLIPKRVLDVHQKEGLSGALKTCPAILQTPSDGRLWTIDSLLLEYVEKREARKEIEVSVGLTIEEIGAIIAHLRRGTYSHINARKRITAQELNDSYNNATATDLNSLLGRIVEKYTPLVMDQAKMFGGVEFDDLVQEGMIAVANAAEQYNPHIMGFIRYAKTNIYRRMSRLDNISETIRSPVHARTARRKTDRARFSTDSIEQISKETNLPTQKVEQLLNTPKISTTSLDKPIDEDTNLHQAIPDKNVLNPLQEVEKAELHSQIVSVLDQLPQRLQKIIIGRYFDEATFQEMGDELGLTGERIRQLESEAVNKLQELLKQEDFSLDEFLDE
jgi:RNA polymerase sigma factor (sigma-70 family)